MITNAQYTKMPYKYATHANFARVRAEPSGDAELLITAARTNDAAQIRVLLASGADVDAQDEQGWTALSWAVKHRNAAAATLLVEAGANSEIEARDGWTPMALAVKGGSPTIISIAMGGLDRHVVKQ